MSTTSTRPPVRTTRADFRERARRRRRVVQNERQHRDVELAGVDRQALQLALAGCRRCVAPLSRCRAASSMSVEPSTAYHAPDVRRHRFRQLSSAAAEVADDQRRDRSDRARPRERTSSPNSSPRSRSHPPAAVAKNSCDFARRRAQHAAQPALVLPGAAASTRPARE